MSAPGRDFDYASMPEVFLGRTGRGPLRVAWDTDVLVDYLEHGRALWGEGELGVTELEYRDDLEALGALLQLYVLSDVEFLLLERTVGDARERLEEGRRVARLVALEQFVAAFSLSAAEESGAEEDGPAGGTEDHRPGVGQTTLWPHRSATLSAAGSSVIDSSSPLAKIPAGGDRQMVEEALRVGAHVYLTRDRRVWRSAPAFAGLGLLLARPSTLLDLLVLDPNFWAPGGVEAPAPDFQRVSHLIQALGPADERGAV